MMNKSLISPGSAPLDSSGSTSPDNTIHFPPSPSSSKTMRVSANVAKVIQLFRKHRDGKLEQSWIKTRLHADEYEELNILLERREPLYNYVNDKVGFDYDPRTLSLVIRMGTPLHDLTGAYVQGDILHQILMMKNGNDSSAELAKEICSEHSAQIILEDGALRRPDVRFGHEEAQYPGVIIEIANPQEDKNLEDLAEQYVLETSGSVRVVIGIKLGYCGGKLTAGLSVWRPHCVVENGEEFLISKCEINSEVFRKEDGTAVGGKSLILQISDFVPPELAQKFEDARKIISIPYSKLAHYLSKAEERNRLTLSRKGIANPPRPASKKRFRERTPPKELRSEDERSY